VFEMLEACNPTNGWLGKVQEEPIPQTRFPPAHKQPAEIHKTQTHQQTPNHSLTKKLARIWWWTTDFGVLWIFVFIAEMFRLHTDVAQMWLGLRERLKTGYFLPLWLIRVWKVTVLAVLFEKTLCHAFSCWIIMSTYIHFLSWLSAFYRPKYDKI